MKNHVILDPHPKFNHRFFGMDYGETYHRDPIYRARELERLQREQFECYHRYTAVVPARSFRETHTLPAVGIQPLDFLNAALGGRLLYSADEAVWTLDHPLSHIDGMADVEKLPELDWPNVPIFQEYCAQFDTLRRYFPGFQPGGFQNIEFQRGPDRATMVIHSPYTTAFRLMGERIFEFMLLEPEIAEALFDYIWRQYWNLFECSCRRYQWIPDGIHIGDCAATMLSPELFRDFSLPRYRKLAQECKRFRLHSCGPSAHLIDLFAQIPFMDGLQIGMGSDYARLRKLFPEVPVLAFLSPALIRNGTPEAVVSALEEIVRDLGNQYEIFLSSVDPDTAPETLTAMLECAGEINRCNHWDEQGNTAR